MVHRLVSCVGCLLAAVTGWADDENANVVVQLPYWHQFQFAGLYAAQTQGYFHEEGLTVELREGVPGLRPVPEVVAGRANYGVASSGAFMDRLRGAPIVALAVIFQHSPFALMVRDDSGIATPADLIGRRIAINQAYANAELRAIFHLEGIKPDQYVSVPDLPQHNELLTGEADAILVFSTDLPFDARQDGLEFKLIRPADYGADFFGDTLFTSQREIDKHPERAAAFRRAVLRGWEYALEHPQEINDWILRNYGGPARPRLTKERLQFEAAAVTRLVNPDLVAIGHMNVGRWKKMADIIVALGLAPDASKLKGWVWAPEERDRPVWVRWVAVTGGTAILLALLALLANRRLQRLVERRTRELQESEKRQREIFDFAPNPIVVEDVHAIAVELDGLRAAGVENLGEHLRRHPELAKRLFSLKRVVAANRRALESAGFSDIDEMNRRLPEIMTTQSLSAFGEELQAIWEGRETLTMAKVYQPIDGPEVHMLMNWSAERVDGVLDFHRVRLVFTDVTEFRRAQAALDESERRYRNLFEATPNPMYIFDAESLAIVMVNEAAVSRYGYTRGEFCAMTVLELRPADEVARLEEAMERFRKSPQGAPGAHAAGMWRHRCKDGTILFVEVFTHSLVLNGRSCVLSLPFDITAQLAAERALRVSEARYRELFENAVGGVYRVTPQGRFISVNPAMARMYGFDDPEEMLEWNRRERAGIAYAHEEEHRRFVEQIERHGKVENFESRITDRHGNTVWISETSRVVHDEEGRLLCYEGFVTDITARRRLESELMRASKLEAVGILAGGIAHDFNNILTVVLGNVTLAELETATDSSVRRMLHDAKRATLRARDLTQQLLTFAKGGDPVRAAVALPELLRESAEFAMHGAKSRCEFDLPNTLWPANVDKGQIGQVVQNLAINAVQAMPDGGTLRISAVNQSIASGEIGRLPAGDYVKISVGDTGAGIPPEHLTKIFDPYFTTKQQGSGLGLATVYSILRKHQGHVEVESRLGVGTTFHLWLPAADSSEMVAAADVPVEASLRARVLFMDDEQPIREMAELFITRLGAEFVGVPDGATALTAYEEARAAGRPFDVVVMDLTVPGGIGGREAMEKLRVIDPQVRAIVSSGYSRDPVLGNYRQHGFCAILPKPYGLDQLRKVLVDVVTQRQSAVPF